MFINKYYLKRKLFSSLSLKKSQFRNEQKKKKVENNDRIRLETDFSGKPPTARKLIDFFNKGF